MVSQEINDGVLFISQQIKDTWALLISQQMPDGHGVPLISKEINDGAPLISQEIKDEMPLISQEIKEGVTQISQEIKDWAPMVTQKINIECQGYHRI